MICSSEYMLKSREAAQQLHHPCSEIESRRSQWCLLEMNKLDEGAVTNSCTCQTTSATVCLLKNFLIFRDSCH